MDAKKESGEELEVVEPKVSEDCYILQMPNEVLVHLLKKLPPSSPEKLAQCCRRLQTLFLNNEHQLLLPRVFERLHLAIRQYFDDEEVKLDIYRRHIDNEIYESFKNPSLSKVKRLLSYAETLEFEANHVIPTFCRKGTEDYTIIQEHLKTCDIRELEIFGMHLLRGCAEFIEMFEKKPIVSIETRAELLEPEKENLVGKVELFHIDSLASSDLVKYLLVDQNITHFKVMLHEFVPVEEYIQEWKEGRREINTYQFHYVQPVHEDIHDRTFERNYPGAVNNKLELRVASATTRVPNVFFVILKAS